MLQALQTLQPCKNTGQNGGVSTKRIMPTTGNLAERALASRSLLLDRSGSKEISTGESNRQCMGAELIARWSWRHLV